MRIEEAWSNREEEAEVEVYINMVVFIVCANPQNTVGPEEHNTDKAQTIETKLPWGKLDIIFEISLHLVFIIKQSAYQLTVDCTKYSKDWKQQKIELGFIDSYSILKVIDDKYEYGREEIDGMHDRKRKIELRCSDGQSMYDNNNIPFRNVIEVSIVLIVQRHIVVPYNCEIEYDWYYSSDEWCLESMDTIFICVEKSQGEENLR